MDLFEAFDLKPGAVVAVVGGGGKTSLVYALGEEAAAAGLAAIITSTTRFTRPPGGPMPPLVEAGEDNLAAEVARHLAPGRAVVASAGPGTRGRMLGVAPGVIDELVRLQPGLLAVEADGSAHRPFKAPAEHEPVIPSSATDVVVCVGLNVLGKPLDAVHVHRPEIVSELSGTAPGEPVTIRTILRVLTHERGGRKGVPRGARLHALLNGPVTPGHRAQGEKLAGQLIFGGFHRAVVATVHRSELHMIAC